MKYSFTLPTIAALSTLAGFTLASNHVVTVGNGGLVFKPSTVVAAKGDTVQFQFYPADHSVAQSTADAPCSPSAGGFFSGYFPSASGPNATMFEIAVNSTDPLYFYCSQAAHCQAGMVGIINPKAVSVDTFQASAKKSPPTKIPPQIQGGSTVSSNSTSSGNSTGSSTASGSATTGTGASSTGSSSTSQTSATSSGLAAGRVESAAGLTGLIIAALSYLL